MNANSKGKNRKIPPEGLRILRLRVIENHNDIAVDVYNDTGKVTVRKKDTPIPENVSRWVPNDDLVQFDLENGMTMLCELNEEMNDLLKALAKAGVPYGKGPDCRRKTPYKT